jgi:hypothetical protein
VRHGGILSSDHALLHGIELTPEEINNAIRLAWEDIAA